MPYVFKNNLLLCSRKEDGSECCEGMTWIARTYILAGHAHQFALKLPPKGSTGLMTREELVRGVRVDGLGVEEQAILSINGLLESERAPEGRGRHHVEDAVSDCWHGGPRR